jgi:hypothetical protein
MRTIVRSKAPLRLEGSGQRLAMAVLFALAAWPACAQEAPAPRAGNPHGDMSLDCRLCHAEQDWSVDNRKTTFDHGATGFALEGQHALVACKDCHKQPQFAHIGTQCADCHLDAHKSQLGPACDQCHTPEGWVARTAQQREHDTTRLPLVGAHARVDCDACHTGPVSGEYVGTPYDCYACHQAEYDDTSDPDHRLAGFTTDCERCHGVFSATWGSGDFIHAPNFPLTGAHATTACASCHAEQFAGTPTDCYACHQPDYDATADPPHATANLGTACATCHGTSAWSPSTYDHATPSDFRLEGGHSGVACVACHETGYVGTSTECYACHRADYEGAADPNHVAAGFPTDCATCHAVTTWNDSNFDHARTAFPLTGAHANQACVQCHAAGYTGTPTDCFACHQADYAQTNNPSHSAAAFPTTCVTCHTTTAWSPSSWDHEALFPIETGKHTNVSCVECHVTPGNYATFECILCHEHNQADMADRHSGRPDYQWNSLACLGCHPRGD